MLKNPAFWAFAEIFSHFLQFAIYNPAFLGYNFRLENELRLWVKGMIARMERTGQKAYLVLENGKVFEGRRFGATGDITGEIVLTTAMTGYLETLTDPSYYGQIVVQTFPLIGNYGVIPSDFESASPALKAYIVREWCQEPSNFRSEGVLGAFLESA